MRRWTPTEAAEVVTTAMDPQRPPLFEIVNTRDNELVDSGVGLDVFAARGGSFGVGIATCYAIRQLLSAEVFSPYMFADWHWVLSRIQLCPQRYVRKCLRKSVIFDFSNSN